MLVRMSAALPLLAVVATLAPAQAPAPGVPPGGGFRRPTTSPYLNLLRGGNPAVNYLGLVRPEQQFRANQAQLQQQQNATDQNFAQFQSTAGPFTGLGSDLSTGTAAGFQTHRGYFLTGGVGGGRGSFGTTGGLRGGASGVGAGVGVGPSAGAVNRGAFGGTRPAVVAPR